MNTDKDSLFSYPCSSVFICVHLCSSVFICVHLCSSVAMLLLWLLTERNGCAPRSLSPTVRSDQEQAEDQHRNQGQHGVGEEAPRLRRTARLPIVQLRPVAYRHLAGIRQVAGELAGAGVPLGGLRSEEHTSELQSLRHLVCRLLLEK